FHICSSAYDLILILVFLLLLHTFFFFVIFFFLIIRLPPTSTLFPYTTLFRSILAAFFNVCRTRSRSSACTAERPSSNLIFPEAGDRKSTRLNSSHGSISYAVFCLKKKKKKKKYNNSKKNINI